MIKQQLIKYTVLLARFGHSMQVLRSLDSVRLSINIQHCQQVPISVPVTPSAKVFQVHLLSVFYLMEKFKRLEELHASPANQVVLNHVVHG